MPTTMWLESFGIPMIVWLEENLEGYTQHLGEWISWSYQKDDGRDFFNPIICFSTIPYDSIVEKMRIFVNDKNLKSSLLKS